MRVSLLTVSVTLLTSVWCANSAVGANPPYVGVRVLSAELAQSAATAALNSCRDLGYQVAAAVVDRSGNLQASLRDPLAGPHAMDVSRRKAYSAATFQASTLELMGQGMDALNSAPDVLIVGGGVPIRVGGHFYGAVGVSGAPREKLTGDIDERCARAGVAAIAEALEFAE